MAWLLPWNWWSPTGYSFFGGVNILTKINTFFHNFLQIWGETYKNDPFKQAHSYIKFCILHCKGSLIYHQKADFVWVYRGGGCYSYLVCMGFATLKPQNPYPFVRVKQRKLPIFRDFSQNKCLFFTIFGVCHAYTPKFGLSYGNGPMYYRDIFIENGTYV